MKTSENIADLAAALAKAQAKIEGAVKDKSNPAFRSKYADLGACWDAIRAPLTEHGLSIVQFPRTLDGAVEVETVLLHQSGQYMADTFAIPVSKRDAHGYMSATTYARRGALMAVAGIAPVDDDGNNAVGNGQSKHIPFLGDPIREAKESVATDDPHLLVNGETRSAYEVNKEKNGGKTPYQLNKEADEWVSKAKAAIAGMTSELEISAWWDERMKEGGSLDRLKKAHPKKFTDLWSVAEERIAQVQRVPRDRNVMEAG